jgi:nucleobase transporter 1/2
VNKQEKQRKTMVAGGGGGGGGKVDEFLPHPVKEQLPGVDYCIRSSPSWRN